MARFRLSPFLLLAAGLGLAGCATPVERCVSQASRSAAAAETELRELEATLARGYAVETSVRTYPVMATCGPYKARRPCIADRVVRVPRRVPVNLAQVNRRAEELRAELPGLRRAAERGAAQCRSAYAAVEAAKAEAAVMEDQS